MTSLRVLGSVGEPINPEAWLWYYKLVGQSKCSIVDTFWQTETGGHVLTPLPGCTPMKPGSAVSVFYFKFIRLKFLEKFSERFQKRFVSHKINGTLTFEARVSKAPAAS
jgi:hypothetical protein